MTINLSSVSLDKAETEVAYGGQTAKLIYKPGAVTREALERMDHQTDGDLVFLKETLIDWDVKKGTKKVPITEASLKSLPMPFLRATIYAILGDRGDSVGEVNGNSNDG